MRAYRFLVTGRVQGVGFRAYVQAEARRMGYTGWVRNRRDGSVEAVVAGLDPSRADFFRQRLQHGPGMPERVHFESTEAPEGDDFRIESTY